MLQRQQSFSDRQLLHKDEDGHERWPYIGDYSYKRNNQERWIETHFQRVRLCFRLPKICKIPGPNLIVNLNSATVVLVVCYITVSKISVTVKLNKRTSCTHSLNTLCTVQQWMSAELRVTLQPVHLCTLFEPVAAKN